MRKHGVIVAVVWELAKSQRVVALVGKGSFKMMTMKEREREKRQEEKESNASVTM